MFQVTITDLGTNKVEVDAITDCVLGVYDQPNQKGFCQLGLTQCGTKRVLYGVGALDDLKEKIINHCIPKRTNNTNKKEDQKDGSNEHV